MTAKTRDAVFQLSGGIVALAIALAGSFAGVELFGRAGRFALVASVPLGVLLGFATIKLLHFAHRILVDEG